MGSCHDISLQLMRQFMDTHEFGIHNWPSEYKNELSPLIAKCFYNKGSLMQTSLQTVIRSADLNKVVEPLPPLHESALEAHQKVSLISTIRTANLIDGDNIEILTIFQKCGALRIGGVVLGSQSGRYQSYSIIMVHQVLVSDGPKLARIHHFARCACVVKLADRYETLTLWFAAVSFFCAHECKEWFGHPTQVWT